MGFNLGGIVKGLVTGVETLVETGNPIAAVGAGALTALSGGSPGAGAQPTFDPVLDELSANLNPGSPPATYSYMQLAGLDAKGNSTRGNAPDLGSIVDGDDDGDGDGGISGD